MTEEDEEFNRIERESAMRQESVRAAVLAQPQQEPKIPFGDNYPGLQWDEVPQIFNDWWDADYDPTGNPFEKDTYAYWAWAGWKAAKQPAQQTAAIKILEFLGYTYHGGKQWKPPLGNKPKWIEQPAQQEPADATKIAAQILTYLGFSQDESIHPGADRRRDTVAMMIENAAPQPAQQEPVASLLVGQDSDGRYVSIAAKVHADTLPLGEHKLYTTPPQRKTLTDEQVAALLEDCIGSLPVAKRLIRAVEAAHGIKENT